MAAVRGREMHVDHLNRRQLFQDGPWRQSWGQLAGLALEGDLEAVGNEGDENVGFDPVVQLMVNGPEAQVTFQFLERLLDIPLVMPLYD